MSDDFFDDIRVKSVGDDAYVVSCIHSGEEVSTIKMPREMVESLMQKLAKAVYPVAASPPFTVDVVTPVTTHQPQGSVDMIASAYEWICPKCENFNQVVVVPKQRNPVVCDECGSAFSVENVVHAVDW